MSYRLPGYSKPAIAYPEIAYEPSNATLLGLPVEIRLQLYRFLFPLQAMYEGERSQYPGHASIIRTCRQIYVEAIPSLYKNTVFKFGDIKSCAEFLDHISFNITYLRTLDITCDALDSYGPHNLFYKLKYHGNLHTLNLSFNRTGYVIFCDPPLYLPSERNKFRDALCYQKSEHLLGELRCLRELSVTGRPGKDELDLAILKLTVNIERLAIRENKKTESLGFFDFDHWLIKRSLEHRTEYLQGTVIRMIKDNELGQEGDLSLPKEAQLAGVRGWKIHLVVFQLIAFCLISDN